MRKKKLSQALSGDNTQEKVPSWTTDQWMQHDPSRDRYYLDKAKDYLRNVNKQEFRNIQQYGGAATVGIPYGDPSMSGDETAKYFKLYDYIKTRPNLEGSVRSLMNASHRENRNNLMQGGKTLSNMLAGNDNMAPSALQTLADSAKGQNIPGQYLSEEARRKLSPYLVGGY